MAKYLLLKHYRGAPAAVNDVPMDQWTPAEFEAHIKYMSDFADRLKASLIVIGLRRRTPTGKLLTGSQAQRTLLDANCPVLAVKASD